MLSSNHVPANCSTVLDRSRVRCHSHTVVLSNLHYDKILSQECCNITFSDSTLSLPPGQLYINTTPLPFQNVSVSDSKGQSFTCIYFNAIHTLLKPFRNHPLAPGPPTELSSKGMLARELLLYSPCQGQHFKVKHRRERCKIR